MKQLKLKNLKEKLQNKNLKNIRLIKKTNNTKTDRKWRKELCSHCAYYSQR